LKRISLIAILLVCFLFALYEGREIINKPIINFISISNDSIVSLKDTLLIRIKFADRDGDVGKVSKGASKIFVIDEGYNVVQEFPIVLISRDNNFPTEGTLKVLLDFLPVLNISQQRNTTFKIYITDCAGHNSNVVETPPVNIIKPHVAL
jgi:hypothetical protein